MLRQIHIAITPFSPVILVLAYVIDLIAGDPEWMPHPVRWMGKAIDALTGVLLRPTDAPPKKRAMGGVLALVIVVTVYAISALILHFSHKYSYAIFFAVSTYMVWTSLSVKSLKSEARAVISAMKVGGIEAARLRLGRIVGRDTGKITEDGVARGVIETVSENTSDGIVAPLFYLAIGGPALMVAYKAVNTLDSMVGYKNDKYRDFGSVSARLDDIANYVPARITALLNICSAFMLGYDWRTAISTVRRDGRKHPSPNSGYPEASVAGALGVRLGGPMEYGGVLSDKPFIGDDGNTADAALCDKAINIMQLTAFFMVFIALCVRTAAIFIR